jgi:N-acetylglucosamine-6-phosphate deacetylase
VLVDGDTIAWVGSGRPPGRYDDEITVAEGGLIAPGFIDLQVNGYRHRDAADGAEAITEISQRLPATGVTAFLPTLISRPLGQMTQFVETVGRVKAPGARILGAHLEGPFLSRDYKGAHDPTCLVDPTPDRVAALLERPPRMLTLAPELPGARAAIARLDRAGVLVSAGHSGADFEQGLDAVEAGVRFGTHVFNAMPRFHHRRPALAAALLLDKRVAVGLVMDGEHLHPATCELVLRSKPASRTVLTTDQTAAAGAPAGKYRIAGLEATSDGRAVRLHDGTLAGSAATMDLLVRNAAQLPAVGSARAIAMASGSPAAVLGERRLGRIASGALADLVVLDEHLKVSMTFVGGRLVYER